MGSETDALREGNWWKLTAVHENDGQYAWPLGENSVLQEHLAEFNFFLIWDSQNIYRRGYYRVQGKDQTTLAGLAYG